MLICTLPGLISLWLKATPPPTHPRRAADETLIDAQATSHRDQDCDSILRITQAQLNRWMMDR